MTTWNPRANDLFLNALELGSPGKRQEYLDGACAGDAALRAEVESLLEASARAGGFLEPPAVGRPAAGSGQEAEGSPQGRTIADCPLPAVQEGPGTVLGPYKLIEQIGQGGMGSVWMAQQQEPIKRVVAVKLIRAG